MEQDLEMEEDSEMEQDLEEDQDLEMEELRPEERTELGSAPRDGSYPRDGSAPAVVDLSKGVVDLTKGDIDLTKELELIKTTSPIPGSQSTPPEWNMDGRRTKLVARSMRSRQTKHGLLASIPMICKDEECPYKRHCEFQQRGEVIAGERCVLEIGKLIDKADRYYKEFGLDPDDPAQTVDLTFVKKLLMAEIMIERCEMLLADNPLIEIVDVAMNPHGEVISQPQLHKADDALRRWQRIHSETMSYLAATRKDKINQVGTNQGTISEFTKLMIERASLVNTRLRLIDQGKTKEAETMGMQYGINIHLTAEEHEREQINEREQVNEPERINEPEQAEDDIIEGEIVEN